MTSLAIPILQIPLPEQVPTSVVAIIGLLALMVYVSVGYVLRGWLRQVSANQAADIALRKQDAVDRVEESRANRAALMQVVSFMAALNENMRVLNVEVLRAAFSGHLPTPPTEGNKP